MFVTRTVFATHYALTQWSLTDPPKLQIIINLNRHLVCVYCVRNVGSFRDITWSLYCARFNVLTSRQCSLSQLGTPLPQQHCSLHVTQESHSRATVPASYMLYLIPHAEGAKSAKQGPWSKKWHIYVSGLHVHAHVDMIIAEGVV